MRLKDNGDSFTIWLSANDTYDWAHKSGAAWPCSTLSGHRLVASFDDNGLCDFAIDGKDSHELSADIWIDSVEFNAIVADHARERIPSDHPCYFVAVGQFD